MAGDVVAFAPGRVNLIGEHTDYNDGLALPFAVADGVEVRASRLSERRIEARALDLEEQDSFELGDHEGAEGWRAFVRGAAAELERRGLPAGGRAAADPRNDPPGRRALLLGRPRGGADAGAARALAVRRPWTGPTLARLCSRVENEWVGAQTGLLDQLASLYGEEDHALRIDFRTLEVDPVPLRLDGFQIVTLDSGETTPTPRRATTSAARSVRGRVSSSASRACVMPRSKRPSGCLSP